MTELSLENNLGKIMRHPSIPKVMKTEEEKSRLEVRSSNEIQDLQRTIEKLREDISAIAEERDDYSKRFDEAVSDKDKNVNDQVRMFTSRGLAI